MHYVSVSLKADLLPQVTDVTVDTINSLVKILSQQEKYHKVYSIAQKLADVASDISSREFGYVVECLKQIVTAWEQGKHVVVEVVNDNADDGAGEGLVFTEDTASYQQQYQYCSCRRHY